MNNNLKDVDLNAKNGGKVIKKIMIKSNSGINKTEWNEIIVSAVTSSGLVIPSIRGTIRVVQALLQ